MLKCNFHPQKNLYTKTNLILDIILSFMLAASQRKTPRAAPRTNIMPNSNDSKRNPTYENVNRSEDQRSTFSALLELPVESYVTNFEFTVLILF